MYVIFIKDLNYMSYEWSQNKATKRQISKSVELQKFVQF